ncbi:prohead protease/major capsid protein fusion protein [Hyphomonas sp. ND6WE1B]|uniref:prohead protease/major capsid protein fusion protein n=1 Tax=Hyphomonas sp. ND6WE1B TaxID=1848191 RepID=UPI000807609C|nr:prohead protease/major capsid protein fusion protein [Hyphomonas sp. ND6WE1B]
MTDILSLRKASLRLTSYDPATRRFHGEAWNETPVRMGGLMEIMQSRDGSANLSRMPIPLLRDHRRDLEHRIGQVTRIWFENGHAMFEGELSPAAALTIGRDMEAGQVFDVSPGYTIDKFEIGTGANGERLRTVTAYTIHEISLTAVGATPGAKTRSFNKGVSDMEDELEVPETPAATKPVVQTRAQMNSAIRQLADQSGLDADWANGQIDAEATIEAARSAALEAMQARHATVRVASPQAESPEALTRNLADALYARMSGAVPAEQARQYMGNTLADDARAILVARGESVSGLSREAILERAMHTTSDFPNLLTATGNRTLRAAYEVAQSPLKLISRQTTAADFRPINRLQISEVGALDKLTESGEVKSVTRGEAKESYSLDTAAAMFSLSRKALVNDDLGAFGDWSRTAGRQAAEYEAKTLVALLESNPTMGDTKALFHTDHGNIAASGGPILEYDTGGTVILAALADARLAMRMAKGLDGVTPIAATPKYLLVHPNRETEAEQALAAIQAATTGDVNPFSGKLQLLVEPRLTDDSAWYVFADPAQLACFEHAYLSGAQGPQIATREGWRTLGMEMRVILDFGAGAVDWRGGYKNEGD